ncbi:hypothetical protein CSKR_100087, partial [Clonorchis sinensis]
IDTVVVFNKTTEAAEYDDQLFLSPPVNNAFGNAIDENTSSSGSIDGPESATPGHLMFQLIRYSRYRNKLRRQRQLKLQTIEHGSKTLICISFTKLNIHLLLERVFLNFSEYSLTFTQMQANATKRLHQFRKRSQFSRDAKRICEKTCYSHASSVVSTVTPVVASGQAAV